MKRSLSIWSIYLVSLIVMVAVMSWVTYSTLNLEQEERTTALRAENERLALWRMESALLPLILEESSRELDQWWVPESMAVPPELAARFPYPTMRISELATFDSAYVSLHFQLDSNGVFISPQVPGETLQAELVALGQVSPNQLTLRQAMFADLKATTTPQQLFEVMRQFQPGLSRLTQPATPLDDVRSTSADSQTDFGTDGGQLDAGGPPPLATSATSQTQRDKQSGLDSDQPVEIDLLNEIARRNRPDAPPLPTSLGDQSDGLANSISTLAQQSVRLPIDPFEQSTSSRTPSPVSNPEQRGQSVEQPLGPQQQVRAVIPQGPSQIAPAQQQEATQIPTPPVAFDPNLVNRTSPQFAIPNNGPNNFRVPRPRVPTNGSEPFQNSTNLPPFGMNDGAQNMALYENVRELAENDYNQNAGRQGTKGNPVAQEQAIKSVTEMAQRMNNSLSNGNNYISRFITDNNGDVEFPFSTPSTNPGMAVGPMTSFWLNDQLFLARKVVSRESEFIQGCLLHWPSINEWLQATVSDLLPNAKLIATEPLAMPNHLSLATLPVQLVPGAIAAQPMPFWSPIRSSLAMAWMWLSLSAAAIGGLLFGVVRLSERRAAFVSAVTHELRTPLTTFKLYADLLSNRAKLSDEKYDLYVGTLRNEAERLGHLVENVLSWSRLERTNDKAANVVASWGDILSHMKRTLHDRAAQASMQLRISPDPDASSSDDTDESPVFDISFIANPSSVEQILFNLIDNACKYARPTTNPLIEIVATVSGTHAIIRVTDHGPGINADIRKRLFHPFSKSAAEAAKSAPGVGLGLSLCRRLARNMNGELTLESSTDQGVVFELKLPACEFDPK